MHALIEAADAARKELRRKPVPEAKDRSATYRLALTIGNILHEKGLKDFNDPFFVDVRRKLGHKISLTGPDYCSVDNFFWVCGFSTDVFELVQKPVDNGVQEEKQYEGKECVSESERVDWVLKVCDAIVPSKY